MYCLIRSKGYDNVKKDFSKASFYRLVGDLLECGFSKAYLQNLNENELYRDIKEIDVLKIFESIDFENQCPSWYIEPKSSFDFKQVA